MNFTEYPLGSAKGLMEFDNSGDIRKPPVCEPFKVHRTGGKLWKVCRVNPCEMGMQVSCGVDTEVLEEEVIWGIAEVFGRNIS
jgi:hypothetical protein